MVLACHRKYPKLDLTVTEAAGNRLAAWIARGALDIAVTCAPPRNAGMVSEALAAEPLHFVAPPGRRLAEGPEVPLRAVLDAELVLPPKPAEVHGLPAGAARASGATLRIARTVESMTVTKDLVRGGFACAIMPRSAVRREAEDGRLAAPRIVKPQLSCMLCLTCAQDRLGSKAVEAVRGEIRVLAAEPRDAPRGMAPARNSALP